MFKFDQEFSVPYNNLIKEKSRILKFSKKNPPHPRDFLLHH